MNEKVKKTYEAPQLEEFDCRVEKGFAPSSKLDMSSNGGSIEGRRNIGNWNGEGHDVFT